jgi:hypothetical protein
MSGEREVHSVGDLDFIDQVPCLSHINGERFLTQDRSAGLTSKRDMRCWWRSYVEQVGGLGEDLLDEIEGGVLGGGGVSDTWARVPGPSRFELGMPCHLRAHSTTHNPSSDNGDSHCHQPANILLSSESYGKERRSGTTSI